MVGDNKILTVSYGTFSCTLEGFDDPFSTMKNIAEYFRDLAAGDRFFGAEPPQPDPEMLQSIAENTIQARVNAQLSDNNLVLRQGETTGSAPSAVAPAAAVAAAAVVAPHVAPEAPSAPGVETVAEKLQRIRAVVSRETAQDALFSEDQHVDEFAAETTAPFEAFDNSQDTEAASILDQVDVDDAVQEPQEDILEDRIETDDTLEDVTVEELEEPAVEDVVEDAQAQDDVVDEVADEVAPDETVAEEAATDEALADEVSADEIATDDTQDQVSDETVTVETNFEDEDGNTGDIDLSSITGIQDSGDTDTEVTAEELDPIAREEAAETAVDNVLGRVSDDADAEDATPRRRIVVQKISREDLKAARAETDDTSDVVADDAVDPNALPPEQEEDLLRELAALQSDDATAEMSMEGDMIADELDNVEGVDDALSDALSDLVAADEEEHSREELNAARELRRARRDAITEDDAEDVERLISTTTSRIDNDESSSRRASIAHLKAAVAATKADSSLTEAALEQEARERDQYAEDLARVVRPERATRSTERVKTNRPAPLVLVSELRIDKSDDADESSDTTTDEGPVRPRRINRAELDAQADTNLDEADVTVEHGQDSFAEFAAAANALELPDLLEAAAAYYTYVESTEQFTRPMLMRKIATISEQEGFSREAGLRSFGTLLREGKLVKGSDGKFVIAKSSRFTPEARYAGE